MMLTVMELLQQTVFLRPVMSDVDVDVDAEYTPHDACTQEFVLSLLIFVVVFCPLSMMSVYC